ncbi:hypothetical protein [Legionella sp.]|uniref:hypothetical protein n=1 Tax=Legionella sp. TaxID=459 RepID=UPI003C84EB17
MTVLIKPLLPKKPFESTMHRYKSLFTPIQKTKEKESDFLAFIATPLLDYFVLNAAFTLDALIRIINVTATLLKAVYLWTMNQQRSEELIDKRTNDELEDVIKNVICIASSMLAQFANILLSTACLFTRPIASFCNAAGDCVENEHNISMHLT